jgi:hypothetical protein
MILQLLETERGHSGLIKLKTDDAKSEGRMYENKGNLMSSLLNRMIIDTIFTF